MPTKGLTAQLHKLPTIARAVLCRTCRPLAVLRSLFSATPRLQLLPTYVPTVLLAIGAATGGFGGTTGVLAAMGVVTLGLVSFSLLL